METEEAAVEPGQDDPKPAVPEQPPGEDVPGPNLDDPEQAHPGTTHSPPPGETVSDQD
jgi:hypothetical protein